MDDLPDPKRARLGGVPCSLLQEFASHGTDGSDSQSARSRLQAVIQSAVNSISASMPVGLEDADGTIQASSSSAVPPGGEVLLAMPPLPPLFLQGRLGGIRPSAEILPGLLPGMQDCMPSDLQALLFSGMPPGLPPLTFIPGLLPSGLPPSGQSLPSGQPLSVRPMLLSSLNIPPGCSTGDFFEFEPGGQTSCDAPSPSPSDLSHIPPGNRALMRKKMGLTDPLQNKGPSIEALFSEGPRPLSPLESEIAQLVQSATSQLGVQQPVPQSLGGQQPVPCVGSQLPQMPPDLMRTQPLAAQVYMLAQTAEESAQAASAAAAVCATLVDTDPAQSQALTETAIQASQKATWAVNWLLSYLPASNDSKEGGDWFANMRQIIKQSAEVAENAAQNCRTQFADVKGKLPETNEEKRSKVPCKWFVNNFCRNGDKCEFSHDVSLEVRALDKKRAVECVYFQKGQCTRGGACPFAHGPEELAEINRIVTTLRTEKRLFRGFPPGRHH